MEAGTDPAAWMLHAQQRLQAGDISGARVAALRAAELAPSEAQPRYVAGRVERAAGDDRAAELHYRAALALAPAHVDALVSLGAVLRARGALAEAIATYEQALRLAPAHEAAATNLANALEDAGRGAEAIALHEALLARSPGSPQRRFRLALALYAAGRQEEALEQHERAALAGASEAAEHAGTLASGFGLPARAAPALATAAAQGAPVDFRRRLLLPAIPDSVEDIQRARQGFREGLETLEERLPAVADPLRELQVPTFYLAYHGLPDRELLEGYARVVRRACPDLAWRAPHCEAPRARARRLRVGFVSAFMREHSIGRTTRGLVAGLSRDRFETFVLNLPPHRHDATTAWLRERSDHYLELGRSLADLRRDIAALRLDVLFYQDIGMQSLPGLLAHARLATVQCTSFGHPDTTGIPTMDYFVSSDLYEPPGGASHYSETLVQLPGLATLAYYYRPAPREPAAGRARFGFEEGQRVYVCTQGLMKVHPDFDAVLAGILRRDGAAQVILIEGYPRAWTEALRARLARAMPDVAGRLRFLPRLAGDDYFDLLRAADVALDTLHFNGMNSSLEALAMGLPVVTLPGALQRGRHTQAMYRRMDVLDCIAGSRDDYVDIAVRLAGDRDWNADVRRRIATSSPLLFEDRRVIDEFERFFETAVERACGAAL